LDSFRSHTRKRKCFNDQKDKTTTFIINYQTSKEKEENMNRNTTTTKDLEIGDGSSSLSSFRRRKEAAVIEVPALGFQIRGKYQIKAALQSLVFVSLVAGYCVMNSVVQSDDAEPQIITNDHVQNDFLNHRTLEESTTNTTTAGPTPVPCDSLDRADPTWLLVFYCLGVLYMFLALAIACDEFFVPALEEMASPRRMNLSMDVAGTKDKKERERERK
jgi:hypothetical protein